jgi:hypothetical protein
MISKKHVKFAIAHYKSVNSPIMSVMNAQLNRITLLNVKHAKQNLKKVVSKKFMMEIVMIAIIKIKKSK